MILGIVGCGQDKLTPLMEKAAKEAIEWLINRYSPSAITSGHSPNGGIDLFAEEGAKNHGIYDPSLIFAPKNKGWSDRGGKLFGDAQLLADDGYKSRNLTIAGAANVVGSIIVEDYPEGYPEKEKYLYQGKPHCYHCKSFGHVKSGGCWTALKAVEMKKKAIWIIIFSDGMWEILKEMG